MSLGIYISVPFCKSKCSYCNFASGVFPRAAMQGYVKRLCRDLDGAEQLAGFAGAELEPAVDSIYLGGGTPSLLGPEQIEKIFQAVRRNFDVAAGAEITVECAPSTLSDEVLHAMMRAGVNRVSLGVQSFVDQEARAVGRLHRSVEAMGDIERLRTSGMRNINVDLIAGLPHQTEASWRQSLDALIASGVPHASVYMLEVDEDSRLGKELLAGGARYHAHFVPDENLTADLYLAACAELAAAGIEQYEISNFARVGRESRHNLKYWTRQPYLGFGVDAHSMLGVRNVENAEASHRTHADAVRLAMPDGLEDFVRRERVEDGATREEISRQAAWEETFFLGLRMNRGVELGRVEKKFGPVLAAKARQIAGELVGEGLATIAGGRLRLTERGRLLSNDVFTRFVGEGTAAAR